MFIAEKEDQFHLKGKDENAKLGGRPPILFVQNFVKNLPLRVDEWVILLVRGHEFKDCGRVSHGALFVSR